MPSRAIVSLLSCALGLGCGGSEVSSDGRASVVDGPSGLMIDAAPLLPLPEPSCDPAATGTTETQTPTVFGTLDHVAAEGWLASAAVVDLDNDGTKEIILPRGDQLVVWRPDGTIKWQKTPGTGRIWASALVGDFTGDTRAEVVVASRATIVMYDADGAVAPGWEDVTWRDEVRALAAGDLDGDGANNEIVAVTTTPLESGGQKDLITAFDSQGMVLAGYPPNTSASSGCDPSCVVTGGFDQTLAVGRLDGDTQWDIVAPQDNAYMSWHQGSGEAYDAAEIFLERTKVPGIRFFLDYAESQRGVSDNEPLSLQAHFTNSAPAIADLDGNGQNDIIVVGSVQNASQSDRKKGTVVFALTRDGTRTTGWEEPLYLPSYLAGLEDFGDTNVVGETQQVTVADLDPEVPGLDLVFAAFDGNIHAVGADRALRWSYRFTSANNILTAGVVVADLSGDGRPEVVFTTYSTALGQTALYILDARGALQHRIELPGRGSMAVPTVADVDGDGTLEIVVSLKDADGETSALIYTVPGSAANCLLWPTGRANDLRNGFFRPPL